MDKKDFLEISVNLHNTQDISLFMRIVNQGIDSHLEAFTQSKFYQADNRLHLDFHVSELSTLTRRLTEIIESEGEPINDTAEMWLRDIIEMQYGIELI